MQSACPEGRLWCLAKLASFKSSLCTPQSGPHRVAVLYHIANSLRSRIETADRERHSVRHGHFGASQWQSSHSFHNSMMFGRGSPSGLGYICKLRYAVAWNLPPIVELVALGHSVNQFPGCRPTVQGSTAAATLCRQLVMRNGTPISKGAVRLVRLQFWRKLEELHELPVSKGWPISQSYSKSSLSFSLSICLTIQKELSLFSCKPFLKFSSIRPAIFFYIKEHGAENKQYVLSSRTTWYHIEKIWHWNPLCHDNWDIDIGSSFEKPSKSTNNHIIKKIFT